MFYAGLHRGFPVSSLHEGFCHVNDGLPLLQGINLVRHWHAFLSGPNHEIFRTVCLANEVRELPVSAGGFTVTVGNLDRFVWRADVIDLEDAVFVQTDTQELVFEELTFCLDVSIGKLGLFQGLFVENDWLLQILFGRFRNFLRLFRDWLCIQALDRI